MAEDDARSSGCGLMVLYNGLFRRRSPPTAPAPSPSSHSASDEVVPTATFPTVEATAKTRTSVPRFQLMASPHHHPPQPLRQQQQQQNRGVARSLSKELDSAIYDYQKEKGGSTMLRASSGNVMLHGHLGNLAGSSGDGNAGALPRPSKEKETEEEGIRERQLSATAPSTSMCRALSRRLDPEELKEMGNEEYRNGRFLEALALYDRAIAMDHKCAIYWSNKAAALIGLGKLLEAVGQCKEALKIDPSYKRVHHRLGTLYLRLGEPEKAIRHYNQSGNEASPKDFSKIELIIRHLNKCNEMRLLKNWQALLKEAQQAISMGADSAPFAFAAQAEALMKLQRHQEADEVLIDAPTFDVDESTKFFGPSRNAYVLTVRAQISMAAGRFENAVSEAQLASRIDPSSKDAAAVARKTKVVASARSRGNSLFKAGRFSEACIAYGEGLDHDSQNSILLCNRAACWMKTNQWERAVEDCNMALVVRPLYHKARLRRAECKMKMEKWEEAQVDYENLVQDLPDNEEVRKALSAIQCRLKENSIIPNNETNMESEVMVAKVNGQFRNTIASSGTSVVLFCNEASESKQMTPFMAQLSRSYPSINFQKVDKEDLINSEGVRSLPAFRIYKNGSIVKEIYGADWGELETSIKSLVSL